MTANRIDASAGGLATINGLWQAPDVELWSNDIEIAASGGIDGGAQGLIRLVSTNATQALIGGGLTGTGYVLSNAEFGRLSGGQCPDRGSWRCIGGDRHADRRFEYHRPYRRKHARDPLRRAGVRHRGSRDRDGGRSHPNRRRRHRDRICRHQCDRILHRPVRARCRDRFASRLTSNPGRRWAANSMSRPTRSTSPRDDPRPAGRRSALCRLSGRHQCACRRAAARGRRPRRRPSGSNRDNLQSHRSSRTRERRKPAAGFVAKKSSSTMPVEGAGPPGSIELIVNGQLVARSGDADRRGGARCDRAKADLTPFTDNSMINGCLLSGACGEVEPPEPPFPPGFTPTPGIQQEIG